MPEFNKQQAERNEIDLLIQKGLSFKVERTLHVWTLLGRKPVKETLEFTIQEPTLTILDRLSAEQIELDANVDLLQTENGMPEARRLAHRHAKRMARIVAIATLGEGLFLAEQLGGRIMYRENSHKLKELTNLFITHITPSKLDSLVRMINAMSNMGDFCNSIRLMSISRTTMPDRIEKTEG